MNKVAVVVALSLASSVGHAQTVPAGWETTRHGDEVSLSPRGLEPGQAFAVAALPSEPAGNKILRDWFVAHVTRDLVGLEIVKQDDIVNLTASSLKQGFVIKVPGGQVRVAIYLGGAGATGYFELYRIVTSRHRTLVEGPHMKTALEIIKSWPVRIASPAPAPRPAPDGDAAADIARDRLAPAPRPRNPDGTDAYRAAPRDGIKPSEIEMFAVELDMRINPLDMSVLPTAVVYLVLKSGDYLEDFELPPSDIDVAAHQQAFPGRWGKWRRRGDTYERLDRRRGWSKVDWHERLYPAAPGEELRGTFSGTSGLAIPSGSGRAGRVSSSRQLTFLPGGRFQYDLVQGFTGNLAVKGAARSRPDTGSYQLDGTTIELHHDDGRVERRAFLWGSETKTSIRLGTQAFLRDDGNRRAPSPPDRGRSRGTRYVPRKR